jgi:hypothetical protein
VLHETFEDVALALGIVEDLDLGVAFDGGDLAGDIGALLEELEDGVVEGVDARAGCAEAGAEGRAAAPSRPLSARKGLHAGMVA